MTDQEAVDFAVKTIQERKMKELMNAYGTGPENISTIPVSPIEIVQFLVDSGYITKEEVPDNFKTSNSPKTSSVSQGIAFRPRVRVPMLQKAIPGTRKNRKNNRKNSRRAASRNNRKNSRRDNRKNNRKN